MSVLNRCLESLEASHMVVPLQPEQHTVSDNQVSSEA